MEDLPTEELPTITTLNRQSYSFIIVDLILYSELTQSQYILIIALLNKIYNFDTKIYLQSMNQSTADFIYQTPKVQKEGTSVRHYSTDFKIGHFKIQNGKLLERKLDITSSQPRTVHYVHTVRKINQGDIIVNCDHEKEIQGLNSGRKELELKLQKKNTEIKALTQMVQQKKGQLNQCEKLCKCPKDRQKQNLKTSQTQQSQSQNKGYYYKDIATPHSKRILTEIDNIKQGYERNYSPQTKPFDLMSINSSQVSECSQVQIYSQRKSKCQKYTKNTLGRIQKAQSILKDISSCLNSSIDSRQSISSSNYKVSASVVGKINQKSFSLLSDVSEYSGESFQSLQQVKEYYQNQLKKLQKKLNNEQKRNRILSQANQRFKKIQKSTLGAINDSFQSNSQDQDSHCDSLRRDAAC